MATLKKDPLLGTAQVILALGIALFIFVAAMMLIGLGAVLVGRGELMSELARVGAPDSLYWAVVALLMLIGVLMAAGVRFLLELRDIVRSVDRGDPFEPANADRLARMGWIAVAAYALSVAIGAIATWAESAAGEAARDIDADVSLGGGGILLILVLFILARVFRKGAAMREDLEGTV